MKWLNKRKYIYKYMCVFALIAYSYSDAAAWVLLVHLPGFVRSQIESPPLGVFCDVSRILHFHNLPVSNE